MSPRGFSDWNVQTGALAGADFDLSENSGRLGYPEVFNRLGRVVFWEKFGEDINPWLGSFSGAGASGALDTLQYLWKPASLILTPGTDVNMTASEQRTLPGTRSGKIGVASVLLFTTPDVDMRLRIAVFNVVSPSLYEVALRGSDGQITVRDEDAVYQEIGSVGALGAVTQAWVFVKMTIDWENQRYDRVQINDTVLDASDHPGDTIPFTAPPHLAIRLFVEDNTGGGDPGHFDFVAVTIDEP